MGGLWAQATCNWPIIGGRNASIASAKEAEFFCDLLTFRRAETMKMYPERNAKEKNNKTIFEADQMYQSHCKGTYSIDMKDHFISLMELSSKRCRRRRTNCGWPTGKQTKINDESQQLKYQQQQPQPQRQPNQLFAHINFHAIIWPSKKWPRGHFRSSDALRRSQLCAPSRHIRKAK